MSWNSICYVCFSLTELQKAPSQLDGKHYTYMLCYPDNSVPYYIGIGYGRRVLHKNRNTHAERTREKLERDGGSPLVLISFRRDRKSALILERMLIQLFGREDIRTGILTNLTDGGEGGSVGRTFTAETRDRMRQARLGRKLSPETKAKMSARLLGNTHLLGHNHSEETKAKISAVGRGRKQNWTAETRFKMAERMRRMNTTNPPMKGRVFSEQHKQRISLAARTRKHRP